MKGTGMNLKSWKLLVQLFLLAMPGLLLSSAKTMAANGTDGMALIRGHLSGEGADVRVLLVEFSGQKVYRSYRYLCDQDSRDFAFALTPQSTWKYSLQVQVYATTNGKTRMLKMAQFPLELRRNGHYEMAVNLEMLDNKLKKGILMKPVAKLEQVSLVKVMANEKPGQVSFEFNEIVKGEETVRCIYETAVADSAFYFAVPQAKESFFVLRSNSKPTYCYLKSADNSEVNLSDQDVRPSLSAENAVLQSWLGLLNTIRVDANSSAIWRSEPKLSEYYSNAMLQLTQGYNPAAHDQWVACSPAFKAIFPLLQRSGTAAWLLESFRSYMQQSVGMSSPNGVAEFSAWEKCINTVIGSGFYNDSRLLGLPGVDTLLALHSKMLAATHAAPVSKKTERFLPFKLMMGKLEAIDLQSFWLKQHLKTAEVFNYTEFQEMFGGSENLVVGNEALQIKFNELKSQFEADAAFIGMDAGDIELPDASGSIVSMKKFYGKVVFIDVWASWCGPCKDQIPYLKALEEHYRNDDRVAFVGISIDKKTDSAKWQKVIADHQLPGTQLLDDLGRSFGRKYRINAIPRFLIIDKNGKWLEVRCPRPSQADLLKSYIDAAIGAAPATVVNK